MFHNYTPFFFHYIPKSDKKKGSISKERWRIASVKNSFRNPKFPQIPNIYMGICLMGVALWHITSTSGHVSLLLSAFKAAIWEGRRYL